METMDVWIFQVKTQTKRIKQVEHFLMLSHDKSVAQFQSKFHFFPFCLLFWFEFSELKNDFEIAHNSRRLIRIYQQKKKKCSMYTNKSPSPNRQNVIKIGSAMRTPHRSINQQIFRINNTAMTIECETENRSK